MGEKALAGSVSISDLLRLPLEARREIAFNLLWSLPREEVVEATKRIASMMQKDILGLLPLELAVQVLSYLEVDDILSFALVSKTWNQICNDQSVWASRCLAYNPPIRPTNPSWADVNLHRQLMSIRPTPLSDDTNPEFTDDNDTSYDLDDRDMPGIRPPSISTAGLGAVTALPRGGFAGVRQTVWERTGLAHLPIFTSSPIKSSSSSTPVKMEDMVEPPVSSYLGYSSTSPEVNYKHLYLAHRTISRRIRNGSDNGRERENGNTPMIIDAISSIEAGGLSGHSEAIYALTLFRHPMGFGLNVSCATCEGSSAAGNEGVLISGRDWLLSGSRDKTMRLWQLDCPKPRVVKVFVGAHAGSVLSLYTVKVGVDVPSSSTNQGGSGSNRKEKMLAVTGGSDGRICVWDLEGDGTVERRVDAHTDSVLCVKGDQERIVSCSKDRTIKVFDLHTLDLLVTIGDGQPDRHRGAINEINLSKDYMYISSQPTDTELTSSISASGDRSIRVWCIRTGAHLTTFEAAHPRGIASLDFLPAPQSRSIPKEDGTVIKGYIVSGSSDATVRLSTLVTVPFGTSQEGLVDPMEGLSFREMMSGNQDVDMFSPASAPAPAGENDITTTASVVRILEGPVCWTDCLCPPALRKPDSTHCMRCWNRGHTALVRSLCLRHNIIISGGYDGTAKVWDSKTGKLLNDLIGARTGRVFAVTGDTARIVSTGLDCRINIWNFAQGIDTSFISP